MFELTHLERLDLSNNKLTDIPPEINRLSQLQWLNVCENPVKRVGEARGLILEFQQYTRLTPALRTEQIAGIQFTYPQDVPDDIPAQLLRCRNLAVWVRNKTESEPDLDWLRPFESEPDLDWLRPLNNITELNLRNNNLTTLPEWLASLTNLTSLSIGGNTLRTLPEWLGGLTNLTTLDIGATKLTTLPEWLGGLTKLTSLDISGDTWSLFEAEGLRTLPEWFSGLTNLTSLDISSNRLTTLPEWLGGLTTLTSLSIGGNKLTTVPEWLGGLTKLTSLDISGDFLGEEERLTTLPESLGGLTNLTSLYLGENKLTTLPDTLGGLTNLTSLDISSNNLTALPEWLGGLTNLTSLDISFNSLTALPEWLGGLTNLTSLDISHSTLTTLPEWLGGLTNLTALSIGGNTLTTLPESLGDLTNLISLNISNNNLTTLPEWLGGLTNLISLNISNNNLTTLPEWLGGLTTLTALYLGENNLTALPEWLGGLTNLTSLDISGNTLTTLPESLGGLTNLTSLDLGNNQLTDIPEVVYVLTSLRTLSLKNESWIDNKNQITTLSPKLLQLENLEKLNVKGNPITEPPPDIVAKGLEAIKEYFRQTQEQGTVPLYAAKVLLVGEPGAGKTTLLRKLLNSAYPVPNTEQESTLGVEVHTGWSFPMPNNPEIMFSANLWDFGGQQIQYLIHHFFLSSRALYVLVADDREQRTDFDYWFRIIELLGDNSPVLVVLNEKQHHSITNFDAPKYRERYAFFRENPRDVDFANMADGRFDVLRRKIQAMLAGLPHVGTPLPAKWPVIQQALEVRRDENHIPIADYFALCREHGITKESDQLLLSGYLHDLGLILHFQKDLSGLADTVIVNPAWATRGVYQLLSDTTVEKQQGRFSRHWLDALWESQGYNFMERGKLLALMLKDNFELCFKLSDANGGEYLAPQLLPAVQPEFVWDARDNLRFRYQYPFLPNGVLARLIVRLSDYVHNQDGRGLIWGRGAVFRRNGVLARVIEDETRREGLKVIDLAVSGGDLRQRQELLAQIRGELDYIHTRSFARMAYTEMIPCLCDACCQSAEPTYFEHDELLQYEREGERLIKCRKGRLKNVEVRALLDGIGDLSGWNPRPARTALPQDLRERITAMLTTLPDIETAASYRAFVLSAGLDQGLIAQLSFNLPIAQAVPGLVSVALSYGCLGDNRHPLLALLQQAHNLVGSDRQIECRALIQEVEAYL